MISYIIDDMYICGVFVLDKVSLDSPGSNSKVSPCLCLLSADCYFKIKKTKTYTTKTNHVLLT